jgi:hypothetical protein
MGLVVRRCRRFGDIEAASAMRHLIDTVTVSRNPTPKGGVEVEMSGRLGCLLAP